MEPTRVMVVAQKRMLRGLYALAFESSKRFSVVGTLSWDDMIVSEATHMRPAGIALDLEGAPRDRTIDLVRELTRPPVDARVLCVADQDDPLLFDALDAGASGVVDATQGVSELVDAMRAVVRSETVLSAALARRLLDRLRTLSSAPPESDRRGLSEREIAVVQAVADGLTNAQIARALTISPSTVKNHLYNVSRKLDASSRSQVVTEAIRRGLIKV